MHRTNEYRTIKLKGIKYSASHLAMFRNHEVFVRANASHLAMFFNYEAFENVPQSRSVSDLHEKIGRPRLFSLRFEQKKKTDVQVMSFSSKSIFY